MIGFSIHPTGVALLCEELSSLTGRHTEIPKPAHQGMATRCCFGKLEIPNLYGEAPMETWVHLPCCRSVHIQWSFIHNVQMFNSPIELVFFFFFFFFPSLPRVPDVQKAQTNSKTLQSNKIARLKRTTYPQNKRCVIAQFMVDTSLHKNKY